MEVRNATIIGLGLMGGSFGLALKRVGGKITVVGHDRDLDGARKAKRLGAIDRAEWNLPSAVEKADLVILAVPVGEMRTVFGQIAEHLKDGCIVTDLASTKEQVIKWAESTLPGRVSFVGGHPMAGKSASGIGSASAELLDGCTYCLCPSAFASEEAVETVAGVVRALGARPLFIDPAEHDSFAAAISHLPYLAAVSLVRVSGKSNAWRDIARLAATGFQDTTRVASANPTIYRDICSTNRENIARWLEAYIAELNGLRCLLLEDPISLEKALIEAKEIRDGWLAGRGEDSEARQGSPTMSDELRQMVLGNLPAGRRKRAER